MFLNTELFGHQRGASNKGYKKIKYGTMVLSTQNLHLGNANVNQRFAHGMVSPAYKTYNITGCSVDLIAQWIKSETAKRFFYNATTVGASVCRRNVEWDTLYEQPLYLPCLAEQEKVAKFLSRLSDRISKQQQFVAALKKYKRGLLTYAFEEMTVSDDADSTAYLFSEIAQRRKEKYSPDCGIAYPCVELEHIEQVTGKLLGSVSSTTQSSIKTVAKSGDVLFGKLRPYLRKFAFAEQDMVCSSEIWAFVPSKYVIPKYLYYLVQTEHFLRVANISSGTKMPRAEWANIEKEPFDIPCISIQEKVVSILEAIDKKISVSGDSLRMLLNFREGLLQQLFI